MTKLLVSLLLILGMAGTAPAQATDSSAPTYDMKAQALLDLEGVQKKFVDLANAVPADKFGWKPSEDTRSFAEVLMHVAGERYQILKLMGAMPPADFNGKTFEKSTTDKAQIIAELDKTWAFAKQTIGGMSNADFAKLLPKLGPQANAGDVVYILVADAHEHLGQAITYARVNGVVPPWTVEAKKKAAEKKAQQK
ncbi:MAG TPA: DinB family protein [Terriglobales bacterium]|nr:DinB family protein [Terriglobales bacterium]